MEKIRFKKDATFYIAALSYAQSLWMQDKPAQALLQLNKAFMCDLRNEEMTLSEWPPPYRAKRWLIEASLPRGSFIGNPVRHYQHLATRMNKVNPIPRRWRAWACFHLAEKVLDETYPRDVDQIRREGIVIPTKEEVAVALEEYGWGGEVVVWQESLCFAETTLLSKPD